MKMDGVNEDELKEIKQDISSLRFELRDGINMLLNLINDIVNLRSAKRNSSFIFAY